ncbi:hypothetical protein [Paeniglutamicibacter antarcticus]|uniref:Uncharacterized protein n=1 Tax=Paeniglutamicibacter antarcticus TaxID=494023 RepID=A0ABP9TSX3_9MICC
MKYKNAAGLFVAGITFIVAGPLIVSIAWTFGLRAAFINPSTELGVLFLMIGALGALLSFVGSILLIAATYRALVKIDALQVMPPTSSRRGFPVERQ